ncbi:hypothetical protein DEH18_26330 [Streptomyces sp. NHF165]|nr:hypothetical protein DEH18_26330 [Streptomyces sp. NHF165]
MRPAPGRLRGHRPGRTGPRKPTGPTGPTGPTSPTVSTGPTRGRCRPGCPWSWLLRLLYG